MKWNKFAMVSDRLSSPLLKILIIMVMIIIMSQV